MATVAYVSLNLDKPSIRLLHVHKGWPTEDIVCELCESYADPEQGIPYKALSYNWGGLQHEPREGTPAVLVDGHRIRLTQNLYSALRHIRRPDHGIFLWVDAICINQDDPREKGHQVKQMGRIYKNAEEVLIWLGTGHEGTDDLLESFGLIDTKATKSRAIGSTEDWMTLCGRFMNQRWPNASPTSPRRKQVLAELLEKPWFKRVWILQEVANARTARVLCGNGSCPARTFALMPSLMRLAVPKHTQAVLDIMPRIRQNTWWSSNRNLHVLLVKFVDSQSSLARDKIYALLGMSDDACNPDTFYPCYLKSDEQVIRDTATFLLCGEVLGNHIPMPDLQLSDLWLPITQLAGKVLVWALEQLETSSTPRSRGGLLVNLTATFIARHLNKGRFEAADLLMILAEKYGEARRVADIFSNRDAHLFFHVQVACPWRLCVRIVDLQLEEEEGPLVCLGRFALIGCSTKSPPKGCIEWGDDRLELGKCQPLHKNRNTNTKGVT